MEVGVGLEGGVRMGGGLRLRVMGRMEDRRLVSVVGEGGVLVGWEGESGRCE